MARSLAASQTRTADSDYREIIGWYEDQLERATPPVGLVWEPIKVGPTWKYENGWVLPAVTLGWRNLAWAGLNMSAPKGGPWTYTLEQARFVLWSDALDPETGGFLFSTAVLQRLKGWGKDPLAVAVSTSDICSEDAVFDHWDGDVPVGKQTPQAYVQIVGVAQAQIKRNTMPLFNTLIPPETKRKYGIQVGKEDVWARGDTAHIEASTSSTMAIEGPRPTRVIRNETQNWKSSNGGHALAGTLEGNLAKDSTGAARQLDICNAYRDGEDSVGQRAREAYNATVGTRCDLHRDAVDWPECLDCQPPKALDFGMLYDSLEAPPKAPMSVEAAPDVIRSIAGDSVWLDTRPNGRIMNSIKNPTNSASESRRKWYNQISAAEDAWADPNDVRNASRPELIAAGEAVVLFGDGSKSGDATGLVATRISDGHSQVLHVQQPKAGQIVDRAAYDLAVKAAMEKYKVVAFWFDPSHAKDDDAYADNRFWWPLCDEWSVRYGKRLKCWPVKSGNRTHAVAFDMALETSQQIFQPACEQVLSELEAGVVTFTESAWLREHMTNAKAAPSKYGISVRKENRSSRHKIDLAVCLIGGRMLRRIYLLSTKKGTPGKGRVIVLD